MGLKPTAFALARRRSNQLSYTRKKDRPNDKKKLAEVKSLAWISFDAMGFNVPKKPGFVVGMHRVFPFARKDAIPSPQRFDE